MSIKCMYQFSGMAMINSFTESLEKNGLED